LLPRRDSTVSRQRIVAPATAISDARTEGEHQQFGHECDDHEEHRLPPSVGQGEGSDAEADHSDQAAD
jgi:hypothetical protein